MKRSDRHEPANPFDEDVVEADRGKEKRRNIHLYDEGELQRVDVLRQIPDYVWFGLISLAERERGVGGDPIVHLVFSCVRARWFMGLQDDLSDLPPANTIAQVASCVEIELAVPLDTLAAISNQLAEPYLGENWWVALVLTGRREDRKANVEVMAYLPAPGSTDPATIGLSSDHSVVVYLQSITRIRPPSILTKLIRFSTRRNADPNEIYHGNRY